MAGQENKDLDYWKNQAEMLQFKFDECRQEMEEFTGSSRELELELERELSESQQQNVSLRIDLRTAQEENRVIKEQEQRQSRRIIALEDQIKNYDVQRESSLKYCRELEQKNDSLEISDRNLTASLSDHAKRIENLIEEKALLENVLEQTRGQKETDQRLRDELRDLRNEMAARNKADEGRQSAQREQRRTMEQNLLSSDQELHRLQAIAGGDFTNGHDLINNHNNTDHDIHRACRERETELATALAAHATSKTVIQNLVRKISLLEAKLLNLSPQRGGNVKMNGQG